MEAGIKPLASGIASKDVETAVPRPPRKPLGERNLQRSYRLPACHSSRPRLQRVGQVSASCARRQLAEVFLRLTHRCA